jgi:hypothetical protein
MEEELVKFIISNHSTRFMVLLEVPIALGWDVSEDCMRDALRRQRFHHRHACTIIDIAVLMWICYSSRRG